MGSTQARCDDGAFALGAVLGGLIGAALAMWYAPRSGEDTRHLVFQQGNAAVTRLEKMVVGERSEDALAEGKALAQQRQIELSLDE